MTKGAEPLPADRGVAEQRLNVSAEALDFLPSNAIVLALAASAGLLTYGLALTVPSISLDDAVRLVAGNVGG